MNSQNPTPIVTSLSPSKVSCDPSTFATSSITVPDKAEMMGQILDDNIQKQVTVARIPNISSKVGQYLLGDVLVACTVTLGVAPFLTIIDKAIVQRAAGSHTIVQSSIESIHKITRNPVKFVKSPMFLMMWGVYAATYTTANTLKTIVEDVEIKKKISSKDIVDPRMGKTFIFLGTTVVNSATTLMKDQAYAKMFGTMGAAMRVPMISYSLWACRDCMVIGSSFVLPEIVSKRLEDQGIEKTKALALSQMACPILTQAVAGPVQLLGLDFANRPMRGFTFVQAAKERVFSIGRNFFSIFGARVSRIVPAYGIGGVGNTYLRNKWREGIDERICL